VSTLTIIFSHVHRKKRNCMLLMATGNVMIVVWPARAQTAHVVVHSC
jgi:hypothetical protein